MALWRGKTQEAPTDAELYEGVRSIVHEEVDELVEQGRLKLEEGAFDRRGPESEPGLVGGALRLIPAKPRATGVDIWVYDDVIGFATGEAEASHEIWSTADPDWRSTVRQLIRCVRDGRYSERVGRGRLFPLKVEMRFAGVPSGRGLWRKSDYLVKYSGTLASVDGRLPMPPEGDFSYEPW